MNERPPFSAPDEMAAMEAEHLPLWRALLRLLHPLLPPSARVMDFGCNRGGMIALLCRGDPEVPDMGEPRLAVGIDVDTPAMRAILARAAEAAEAAAAAAPAAAGGTAPALFTTAAPASFPGQFDLVISHEVVYLLEDLDQTLAGIHASLARGGRFCFATGFHTENPLFQRWRASFAAMGVVAYARSMKEYEAALGRAGFRDIMRDRLLLTRSEYRSWVAQRPSREPNPAWFPGAAEEEEYYTETGKMVLTAHRE